MSTADDDRALSFGSADLRLPDDLRAPLRRHLDDLRRRYRSLDWALDTGFGERPAVIVIDLTPWWTDPANFPMGSDVDTVVAATRQVLDAARRARLPIFFTTLDWDPADPPSPHDRKLGMRITPEDARFLEIDPRLDRQPHEKVLPKKYASAFKATPLHEMLTGLRVDTLIVTGVSTSHCVYATCRDATDSYRVIVPREAVGERCEIMHEVNLLDIEIDLADVLPAAAVVQAIDALAGR